MGIPLLSVSPSHPERPSNGAHLVTRRSHSFTCGAVTLMDLELQDSDVPQQIAACTRIILQHNEPVSRRFIGPGVFCIIPAGAPVTAAGWWGTRRVLVLEISGSLLRAVADTYDLKASELLCRYAVVDAQITHPLFALREEAFAGNPSGPAYIDMIARAIVLRMLLAHSACTSIRQHRGGLSQPSLRRVVEYIDANPEGSIQLRSLAEMSGFSEDHFARAFRESTGLPPYQYLLRRKLIRARELLETSTMPIVEIAQLLNFSDQSHLTKLFRREMGITPGQVRRYATESD